MKLTKKLQDKIKEIIRQTSLKTQEKWDLFNNIIHVLTEDKERSLPEHNMYFACCKVVSDNFPEWCKKILDVSHVNSDIIHLLTKTKFDITSTAFKNMKEEAFNEYFNKALNWWGCYFFECKNKTKDDKENLAAFILNMKDEANNVRDQNG